MGLRGRHLKLLVESQMASRFEYDTTSARIDDPHQPPAPVLPSDDPDWVMVGMAASPIFLYWSWARWFDNDEEACTPDDNGVTSTVAGAKGLGE